MPDRDAAVSVHDRGFRYGDGVFDTLRVYDGRPFLIDEHVGRLVASSKTLGIGGLPPGDALSALIREVITRNGFGNALVRTTVTRGVSDGWEPDPTARPSVVVVGRPFSGYPAHLYRDGASIVVTTIRIPASPPDPVLKSLNRLAQIQAKREAMARGADEAVLCTDAGLVAEGSVSNVFCVDAGRIITPPASVGLLPGITRGVVIDLARREGLACDETPFGLEDLQGADEVFLTSTGMEVLPVTRVDGRPIGLGRPGPIASALRRLYHVRVRENG
ncbi:MAG: aminotransferase class IV [Nitrospirae bacterium]|nr:aminotransferase class IV [Nitrospirota bacterium]